MQQQHVLYHVREIGGFSHRKAAEGGDTVTIYKRRSHRNRVAVVKVATREYEIYAEWRGTGGRWHREQAPRLRWVGNESSALKQGRAILKRILLQTGEWEA